MSESLESRKVLKVWRGNADQCEKKGVAGRAIRKNMKIKGDKNGWLARGSAREGVVHPRSDGTPTPGVLGKGAVSC